MQTECNEGRDEKENQEEDNEERERGPKHFLLGIKIHFALVTGMGVSGLPFF